MSELCFSTFVASQLMQNEMIDNMLKDCMYTCYVAEYILIEEVPYTCSFIPPC